MRTAFAFALVTAITLFLAVPAAGVLAQSPGGNPNPPAGGNPGTNIQLLNPLRADSFAGLLTDILKVVIEIGTVIVVLMLVYVGFLFVTAQGNEGKLTRAKDALLWTVVGALILLGSQAIAIGIQSTVQALSS